MWKIHLDPLKFKQNQFWYKKLFVLFYSSWLKKERENSRLIMTIRESHCLSNFQPSKSISLVYTGYMKWEGLGSGYLDP